MYLISHYIWIYIFIAFDVIIFVCCGISFLNCNFVLSGIAIFIWKGYTENMLKRPDCYTMLFKAFSQDLRASPLIWPGGKQVPLLSRCKSPKSEILYGKSSILLLFSLKIVVIYFGLKSLKLCGLAGKGLLHILSEHLAHMQLCHMQSQCL